MYGFGESFAFWFGGGSGEYTDFLDMPGAPYERITSLCDRAKSRLLSQYRTPRREALVCLLVEPFQRVEDALWQILTRVLDMGNAEGANLDLWGRILGLPRNGLSDDDYGSRLRVWSRVLRSNGRAEELIRIADLYDKITEEGGHVVVDEGTRSGGIVIAIEHAMEFSASTLFFFLSKAKAGGVELQMIWPPAGPDEAFRLSGGVDWEDEVETEIGFSYDDEADPGGILADVRARA